MAHPQYNRFNSLKILAYADRLRAIAEGDMPFPIDWHIYPSNICNHTCDWCMFRQNEEQFIHRNQLPHELLMRACADAVRTGAKLVHVSGGGEPLLNKYTREALSWLSTQEISVALSTNGSLLTPEVTSCVDFVRVSLNAGTRQQHDHTNHANDHHSDWDRILENIRAAAPSKKRDFGLAYVVDHFNWRDIYPFCQVAADCQVDFVHIRPAFWYEKDQDRATRAVMPKVYQECQRAKQDFGDRVDIFAISEKFDGYWTPRSYQRCHAIWTGICLTATGDFAVCQDRTDLRFGAAYQQGASFEEIWNSKEHIDLVNTVVSPGELDRCPRCVWNKRNEIIEEVFMKDEMRLSLV
ncbi:MAG: radical SAM protein [Acidobacteriota bacterium]